MSGLELSFCKLREPATVVKMPNGLMDEWRTRVYGSKRFPSPPGKFDRNLDVWMQAFVDRTGAGRAFKFFPVYRVQQMGYMNANGQAGNSSGRRCRHFLVYRAGESGRSTRGCKGRSTAPSARTPQRSRATPRQPQPKAASANADETGPIS